MICQYDFSEHLCSIFNYLNLKAPFIIRAEVEKLNVMNVRWNKPFSSYPCSLLLAHILHGETSEI
jgi:hypothetical protein